MNLGEIRLLALVSLAFAAAPLTSAQVTYTFTSYDVPAATSGLTAPGGINRRGTVVGSYYQFSGSSLFIYGYSRTSAGVIISPIVYPGADVIYTWPSTLNDQGTQVGFYRTLANHGFIRARGQFTTYDISGATDTQVWGISDKHHLAGSYTDTAAVTHGFLDALTGSPLIVDYPGASSTVCYGLNLQDVLVGNFTTPGSNTENGFLRRSNGTLVQLVVPGAGPIGTYPQAINASGTVTGFYFDAANKRHGFTYHQGIYQTIDYPGSTETIPAGINDAGSLSGIYVDSPNITHGFIAVP